MLLRGVTQGHIGCRCVYQEPQLSINHLTKANRPLQSANVERASTNVHRKPRNGTILSNSFTQQHPLTTPPPGHLHNRRRNLRQRPPHRLPTRLQHRQIHLLRRRLRRPPPLLHPDQRPLPLRLPLQRLPGRRHPLRARHGHRRDEPDRELGQG